MLDIIALLIVSACLIASAVAWQYYLELKTDYPPILRMSIISRHKGRLGIILFITVSCSKSVTEQLVKLSAPVHSDGIFRRHALLRHHLLSAVGRLITFSNYCE